MAEGLVGSAGGNGLLKQSSFSSLLSGKPTGAKPVLKKSGSASSIVTMRAAGDGWETKSTTSTASTGSAASLKAAMCKQGIGGGLSLSSASRSNLKASGLSSSLGVGLGGGFGGGGFGSKYMQTKNIVDAAAGGDLAALRRVVEGAGGGLSASAADLNGRDMQGKTALMHAVSGGSKAIVEYLLNRKVDVNAVDNATKAAMHYVSKRARGRRGSEFDSEQQEIVKLLLAYRAILECRDGNGCTPLMAAVANGDEAVARCILECRADVSVRDSEGQTCVDLAVGFEYKELAQLLREAQERQDKQGGPSAQAAGASLGSSMITRETGSVSAPTRPVATSFPAPGDHSESSEDEVEVECFGGLRGNVEVGKPSTPEVPSADEVKEKKEKKEK
eukprot:CAMPEP_0176166836 /NCGR_PEP_ID=MMETSP0120_2-20121206/85336_1 /TAXON_ID=160619 /ORGANISM="Kryptoperidinium foliaceum, Strain CCMP 1326" /LENGTH=388 /DNA_ID=CAMNT_0017504405 /DNA_START=23 /DNA_END=1185 /DNA_ORIENTATION=-